MFDTGKASEWVLESWPKKRGLVGGLILALAFCFGLFELVDRGYLWGARGVVTVVALAVVVIVWRHGRRIPRVGKGRVGLLLALSPSRDAGQQELLQEFVKALKELVSGRHGRIRLQVLELADQHVKSIEQANELEEYVRYMTASGCVFLLYGGVTERRQKGQAHHVLRLNGMVRHAPLEDQIKNDFVKEFVALLPPLRAISKEDDLFAFTATGQQVGMVAEYIIGAAALMSGELDYADTLLDRVNAQLASVPRADALSVTLHRRVQRRRSNVAFSRALLLGKQFRDTRDVRFLNEAKPYLDRAIALDPKNAFPYASLAIYCFVVDRDLNKSFECLWKCRKLDDSAWRFGLAFLYAYTGNLDKAEKAYELAGRYNTRVDVVNEVEDFILWVLTQEPDKYPLHYCVALLNDTFKEDETQALRDYEEFLANAADGAFPRQQQKARQRVDALRERVTAQSGGS
jgi:tetratricopeptide (TPR) repeat protein